jgi:DNA-binding transcriptional regulator YhcF (GntR family)
MPVVPEREPAYLRVANELWRRIVDGELRTGAAPPSEKQLATEFGVSVGTAHRVLSQLRIWGAIEMVDGRRRIVRPIAERSKTEPPALVRVEPVDAATKAATEYWSVVLRGPDGHRYPARIVAASISDPASFRSHLVGIARVEASMPTEGGEDWVGEFELEVSAPGGAEPVAILRW